MRSRELEEFRKLVFEDELLQAELRDIEDSQEFVRRVVELGATRSLSFRPHEVEDTMREYHQAWVDRDR